jgi:trehalose 6-phosphate phosphatase
MRERDAAAFLEAFRAHPASSAVFLDFDGTLSEIAPTPEGARLHPEARRELERLAHAFPVCVVSGRPAGELGALLGLSGVSLIGLHGLEWREGDDGGTFPGAEPYLEVMRSAREFLKGRGLEALPGAALEDKGLILALHFRARPESGPGVERMAGEAAERFRLGLHRGRQVVELRPPLAAGKGVAVAAMVERHGYERALYAGDDLTDLEAFRALHAMEGEGFSALAVAVVSGETPPGLREECDLEAGGVEGVVALLSLL